MDKCPKCGGTSGFYTKGEVWQYYSCDGKLKDLEIVSEGTMAICLDCAGRIKFTRVLGEKEGERR